MQPLPEIHLHSNRKGEAAVPGSLSNLSIFSVVAAFILLIACVNFINLTTAQAGKRAREVGVRKVIGGTRAQLVLQFLGEAIIITLCASLVALGVCSLLLPIFRNIVVLPLTTDLLLQPIPLAIYFGFSLAIGILAGCYPAFVLSGFRPAQIFKGTFKASPQSGLLRQGLMVIQFTIAITLVIATITVFAQLRYMRTKDLGYDKEGVLALYIGDDEDIQGRTETVKQELLNATNLFGATASSHIPGREPGKVRAEVDGAVSGDVSLLSVDQDFFPFYDIPLIAGRNLSRELSDDATESLLVNESAIRQFGFEKPDDILGKRVLQRGIVVGVVKDFHYTSLHKEIEPMIIRMRPKSFSYISLKINTRELQTLMADLENRWRVIAPNRPFDYIFLDQQLEQLYHSDRQFGQIFAASATLSIVLACLGLFGLVTFVVEQRTKEIGIRKVLGASVASVHVLLSRNFIKPILISIIIATVISAYGMNTWLQGFPYRTKLEIWTFILAGGLAVVVTQLTLSFKSVKAALGNPVDALRND
jgi:putative ABC transport system permease protein